MITFKRTLDDIIWHHIGESDGVVICNDSQQLGCAFTRIRKSKCLAAYRMSVHTSTVENIEAGRDTMTIRKITDHADRLGFDVRFVLVDRNAKNIA